MPYSAHDSFLPPDDENCIIWRYMNLDKFERLLKDQSLWFARADQFGDKHEGSLTEKYRQEKDEQLELSKRMSKPWERQSEDDYVYQPRYIGISCWHMNHHESIPMWERYVAEAQGVVIKSTYSRLKSSLTDDNMIYVGKVRYDIDYATEKFDVHTYFDPFLYKRPFFKDENELRAIIWQPPPSKKIGFYTYPDYDIDTIDKGVRVKVNLLTLIEDVYVKSGTNLSTINEVNNLLKSHGYGDNFPVRRSAIDTDPIF